MLKDVSSAHTNILQGSVATPFRCGDICNDLFIANLLWSVTVREFPKWDKIWQRYKQDFGIVFFWDSQCTLVLHTTYNMATVNIFLSHIPTQKNYCTMNVSCTHLQKKTTRISNSRYQQLNVIYF